MEPHENDNPPTEGGGEQSPPATSQDNGLAAQLRIAQKRLKETEKRLGEFEDKQKAAERSKMDALERAKAEKAELQQQLDQLKGSRDADRKRSAFQLAAIQAGAVDPNAAVKLADLSALEFDGDSVVGVDGALEALKKASPYLFGSQKPEPDPVGSAGGNPGGGSGEFDLNSMSLADFEKNRDTIRQSLLLSN